MKIPKLKKGDIIVIQWMDTNTDARWNSDKGFSLLKPVSCNTIGFFHSKNKKEIKVNHSTNEQDEKDGTAIPIGCVTNIHKLKFV